MKIALIRPGLGRLGRRRYSSLACLEPKALAILAGLTPRSIDVEAFDDRFEALPYERHWDLVALSVGTFQAKRAYEIAAAFRARGVKVVLGGAHPTVCPDEAGAHADAVAIGEAEGIWPEIVRDARAGALRPRYANPSPPALGGFQPRRSIFAGKRYLPLAIVQYGRGCRYACDFCSIKTLYPGRPRYRPVDEIVQELAASGRRSVYFCDDNLVSDVARAKELLAAIAPLRLRWSSQVTIDFAADDELLASMVRSGCQSVMIGFESLDPRNLRQMGKGWSRIDSYERALAKILAAGIMVYGGFVFGYDHDRPQAFARTLEFALRQRLFLANFNHLQPYPGTRLYERLRREERLIYDRWWLDPRYRFGEAVFHPRGMSARQLTDGAAWARARFNSLPATLRRLLDRRANAASASNLLAFLLANAATRQDIRRKRGLHLGAGTAPRTAGAL